MACSRAAGRIEDGLPRPEVEPAERSTRPGVRTQRRFPCPATGQSVVARGGAGASEASEHQGGVMPEVLLDAAGRPRSSVTVRGSHAGRSPRNKGRRYPADPPTVVVMVVFKVPPTRCRSGQRDGELPSLCISP